MSKQLNVNRIIHNGYFKDVYLDNGRIIKTGFSSCVDVSNQIVEMNDEMFVKCQNGLAQIFPTYSKIDKIVVGDYSIEVLIKEITDQNELKSYESLSEFHYKGQRLFGRSAILIATTSTPYLPRVIGYIELTTPFYVNKPRARLLDTRFQHNGISWERWDKDSTKKYINIICRIARCVVYPEFRGVGLGQALVSHAIEFAKYRWQIAGYKPLFLEISADMLKYVPFAQSVGMHYIGDTEGNVKRIHKDLEYLLTNYNRVKNREIVPEQQMGIVMQQKNRLKRALEIIESNKISVPEFLKKLKGIDRCKLKDLQFFNGLISLPKPTYIKGLDIKAENFIKSRVNGILRSSQVSVLDNVIFQRLEKNIELQNVSISYLTKTVSNKYTMAIQNAFNINMQDTECIIIKDLSITICPGEILLVTGSSGAGKTTLLKYLSRHSDNQLETKGKATFPDTYNPRTFQALPTNKSLIQIFAKNDLVSGLQILGLVGLSDAYVYLRKYSELSKGQQFRAELAYTILTGSNILIVDEFCSNLDPILSNVVSYRLRKLVKKLGITVIVGAAHCDNFIHSLKPDKVLRLSTAWDYEILDGDFYSSLFLKRKQRITLQTFEPVYTSLANLLRNQFGAFITSNSKLVIGPILLKKNRCFYQGYVSSVKKVPFEQVTEAEFLTAGFNSVSAGKKSLIKYNNKLKGNEFVYILSINLFDLNLGNCKAKTVLNNG